jgi:para-nitrobenzyl esterase
MAMHLGVRAGKSRQLKKTGRTWRTGFRAAAGIIALGALIASATAASASTVPAARHGAAARLVVATAGGALRGKTAGAMDEFLGIPYAAPPVGPLRWRPPRPAARWTGIRAAAAFAPHCPQPPSAFGLASTSENCLYLNVYAPAGIRAAGRSLPVMVWIHGGAFIAGESNDYDPAALVRHGVIVVTINYRLGALGFLADSALASHPGGPSGNYGLMDQQAALRWVQANIRQFGGNPRNVTLSGESSGGLSVLSQLVSTGARGLFARAIVESGTYNLIQAPLATAEAAGQAFAAKAGCTTNSAACLRALPVSAVVDNEDFAGYRPDLDGAVLTQSIGPALASGQFSRVPVINGTNRDEWRLFVAQEQLDGAPPVTSANYQASIESLLGVSATAAAVIAAQYPLGAYASAPVALGAVGTDAIFACPALTADQSLSRYVPTYAYEFNDQNAPERYLGPVGFPYGAAHESEVQYLFSLQNTPLPGVLTPQQDQLAAAMKDYWTSFARTGSPASVTEPRWPPFASTTGQMLSLIPPRPQIEAGFAAEHHCAFWAVAG